MNYPLAKGERDSGGGNLVPVLIAIVLAPALTVAAMTFVIKMNKPDQVIKDQIIEGGQPLEYGAFR